MKIIANNANPQKLRPSVMRPRASNAQTVFVAHKISMQQLPKPQQNLSDANDNVMHHYPFTRSSLVKPYAKCV